jgi:A/G-specific adenine glycosylase
MTDNKLMNDSPFHQKLQDWYQQQGRHHLPWRNTEDAYAIWISEVMLQQTQVKTVLERFYPPFLERFPNLQTLAEANLQDVLQLWQGLGYYSRAKNLHKAAQIMVAEGRNTLPADPKALITLPGIGRNTAHAIAAFAFHEPVAILEANVKRVVARIFAIKQPDDKTLWEKAESLLNHENPFDYNQSMMDLGSIICTPKAPSCLICPANEICQGKDNPQSYPQKKQKAKSPTRKEIILLYKDKHNRYAMRPRETRFLHGLWEFPSIPADSAEFDGEPISTQNKPGEVSHAYSHFKLEAEVFLQDGRELKGWEWKTKKEITELPLSRTEKKILKLLP